MIACSHGYAFWDSGGCRQCARELLLIQRARDAIAAELYPPAQNATGVGASASLQIPEIVICAAVRANDGDVFRCHRHHDGLRALRDRGLEPAPRAQAQGFITSRNRYVDRGEALRLQLAAGIASHDPNGYRPPDLYSEDLY